MRPPVEEELLLVMDVARDFGCTPWAVAKMMKRHKKKIYKQGRLNAIRFEDVEWLTQHRESRCLSVAKRPAGWLASKQVAELLRVSRDAVTELHRTGEFEAVRVKHVYFYDPEGVEASRLRREPPPPGWIPLAGVVHPRTRKGAPYKAVAKLGLETRHFHVPAEGQRRPCGIYLREADLPRLLADLNIPESYPDRLPTRELARLCQITPNQVGKWLMKGLPQLKGKNGFAWIDPHEALVWLESRSDSHYLPHIEMLRAALDQQQRAA